MDKQLFTLPEFVGLYSISRTSAYREIKDGRLKATKCGRRTLIARSDADAWLSQLRSASSKGAG
jgi:excisionase family DNA binding protein